jgi:hypothetical protein
MRIQKVVNKTFGDSPGEGTSRNNVAGGVSAVVSANVGEDSGSESNRVSSRQRVRIVQKDGKTTISRSSEARGGNDDR